jgi:hypothetical protein
MAKDVQTKNTSSVPSYLQDVDMKGAGVATSQDDLLIPMIRILQALSPEVEKKGAAYIPGAEPGMALMKNAPNPLIDMDKGILFQPVYNNKAVVEWVPRQQGGGGGGGFVASYPEMPDTATKVADANNPKKLITINKETGNLLVETRYQGGFIIDESGKNPPMPAVIPFSSTGHTVAKGWNFLMSQKALNGKRADAWAVYYRIKTKLKTRGSQSWYIFDITDAGDVDAKTNHAETLWVPTVEDYNRGKSLYDSLAAGKVKFEQGIADDGDHDDDGKM